MSSFSFPDSSCERVEWEDAGLQRSENTLPLSNSSTSEEAQKMFLALLWGIFEPSSQFKTWPSLLKYIFIPDLLSDVNEPALCQQNRLLPGCRVVSFSLPQDKLSPEPGSHIRLKKGFLDDIGQTWTKLACGHNGDCFSDWLTVSHVFSQKQQQDALGRSSVTSELLES